MILKVELVETQNFNQSITIIDMINKNLQYIVNEKMIQNKKINIDNKNIENLIKRYILYWDTEYVDNTVISGINSTLTLYTKDEVIKYEFKSKFPYNYNEFINHFKEILNLHD